MGPGEARLTQHLRKRLEGVDLADVARFASPTGSIKWLYTGVFPPHYAEAPNVHRGVGSRWHPYDGRPLALFSQHRYERHFAIYSS